MAKKEPKRIADDEPVVESRSSSRIKTLKPVVYEDQPESGKPAQKKAKAAKQVPAEDEEEEEEEEKPKKKATRWSIGNTIPEDLVLQNDDDLPVNLFDEAKTDGLVIFFYPKANTPGCTTQACSFRDEYQKFQDLGFKVFGCSTDKPKSQKSFRTKYEFPYALLCDPEKLLIGPIGAGAGQSATRSHIVIEKGGKLGNLSIKISPKDSAPGALKFIASL